tara:strand:- start:104 stop:802 length:699 start_codon:yes stop_codon:yes gene_type:complete
MKKLKTLTSLVLVIISCQSQTEFDLATISLPLSFEDIEKDESTMEKDEGLSNNEFEVYKSTNVNFFRFRNIVFDQNFSDEFWSPTTIRFFMDSHTNNLELLHFETLDKENSKSLYEASLEVFGTPDYYNKDNDFFEALWEQDGYFISLVQNHTTRIGEKRTTSSSFKYFGNNLNSLTDYFFKPHFAYYLDYLEVRKSKQTKGYNYEDFAKDKAEEMFGDSQYLDDINDNDPL